MVGHQPLVVYLRVSVYVCVNRPPWSSGKGVGHLDHVDSTASGRS